MRPLRSGKFVVTDLIPAGVENPVFLGYVLEGMSSCSTLWPLLSREVAEEWVKFVNPFCCRCHNGPDYLFWRGDDLVASGEGEGVDELICPRVDGLYAVGSLDFFVFWEEVK